jgi:pimeloyl-ACP methyl ester carboxylesterase
MLTAFFLAAALQTNAPPAAGHWEGYMQRGAARLQVSFDFPAETAAQSLFSAGDLGAIDIPLSDVKLGREIHWKLVGDASTTTFDGTLQDGSMAGAFRDPAGNGTFALRRLSTTDIKPYDERPVTFANGKVQLAGTVYAPRAAGKYPAVIFIHGSGAEGRWANAYLADYVARHGVVALIYDKRGVGASSGDWRTSTMQDLVDDARAGVDLLAHRSDVDAGKIGVYGHSQGGELAAAIAEHNGEVGWIIAADSPIGPQYRQDLYRVDTMLATMYSGKDLADAKALYAEFVDVARAGASHDQLRADIAAAGSTKWLADLGIPDDASWIWNWYDKVGNYDNAPAWGAVRVPVLLLFGADDALVPAQASITQTTSILESHGNERVSAHVFPGADHTLRVPASTPDGWPHNAAGFPQIIVTFARGELQR